MSPELLDDLRLPPKPWEQYGWGRLWRVLRSHSTALLETGAGLASMVRAIGLIWNVPPAWFIAIALFAGGVFQVWAMAYRKPLLRPIAAWLSLVLLGFATAAEALTWQGYLGAIVPQIIVVFRAGRLFRLHNGHAHPGE